jgi:DNA-directed RNA polymerases I, II, and III subunit RPABC4
MMDYANDLNTMGGAAQQDPNDEYGRPKVHYVCGSCGKDNTLDKEAVIRCYNCGHRIFYKKRERKLLQYEAR